ncbi:MAG TPA: S8/S53 family peptidase [Solirubrobacteraceae bacterium]|nr:S8/S53 family peptidase [Solirubrobacteraceae bacterium]
MSPRTVTPVEKGALSRIAERVLDVQSLTHEHTDDAVVIAVHAELVVRPGSLSASASKALEQVAEPVGNLATMLGPRTKLVRSDRQQGRKVDPDYKPDPDGPLSQVEIWRLKEPDTRNSLDESRRLRALAENERVRTHRGDELVLPAISPHHAPILCPSAGGCPAAPPTPAAEPDELFVQPPSGEAAAKVTILDSGYIWVDPDQLDLSHRNLDDRVTVVQGQWLDTTTGTWKHDRPDGLYTDSAGQLDGISGHGTFIAGLISNIAPRTRLEVVGLRNQEVEIGPLTRRKQLGLFETEVAIAHAMLRRCDTDVIQCGFAFPTLDDYPSVVFAAVMEELRASHAPHGGRVAVVAPAGNERSTRRYWPAAHPEVIGVASTNRRGNGRAWFSNWGDWCGCCARGDYVYSTFVHWDGPVEGESPDEIEHFRGWARWDGTSFSAPKVSAAIAAEFAAGDRAAPPADVAEQLIAAGRSAAVTDATLSGSPGVSLPYLHTR